MLLSKFKHVRQMNLHMDCSESNKHSSGKNKAQNEGKGLGLGFVQCFNAKQNNRVLNNGSDMRYLLDCDNFGPEI